MVRAVTPSCSSLSLLRQVSERVQRLLCAPWLEGVGSAGEELPLLQLHPLQERRAREAQQRLPQGVYSFFSISHQHQLSQEAPPLWRLYCDSLFPAIEAAARKQRAGDSNNVQQ